MRTDLDFVWKFFYHKRLGAILLWGKRKDESEHHTIDWNLHIFKSAKLSAGCEIIFTMPSEEGYLVPIQMTGFS